MKGRFIAFALVILLWGIFPFAAHAAEEEKEVFNSLTIYPEYDSRIPKCYDYGVTVYQGERAEKLHVYNRNANGEQMSNRCFKPDFDRRFCEFAFTGEVRVDIAVYRDFTSYSILPSAKEYRNEFHDGIISVWLSENDTNFMVRLDDSDDTILAVFADAPEEYEYDPNDSSVLYVNEKWYDPNGSELIYDVPENIKTIYIAPGCVLYSRLLIKTNDVTVCGHGMLVDPYSDYYDTQSIGVDNYKMVVRVEGSNITLRDFKMIDSQNWNIYLYEGQDHYIYDVKILTARITTDAVAVGTGNVTIDNCVFYVSDNVFTYNGYRGYHHISNCLIGTTCAAFFPQHESKYEIDFTDIYVFRANEGIINNWYNPARHQSEIKHITFENLDCVDVVNTPWIFNAYDMGTADKNFTFSNCHFANIRGDSNIEQWPGKENQAVYVVHKQNYMACSGYRLEFFDCTLDGRPITSSDDLHPQMEPGDIDFTIQNSGTIAERVGRLKTVNYVYDKKVMIGDYLLPLENQPIDICGTFYLPEQEICKALGVGVNSATNGILSDDVKMITLSGIQQYYTEAAYDTDKKCIRLSPVPELCINMLEDFNYTSRFNPYAYPNVILGPYVDANGEVVLRCDVNSNVNYPGMFTNITNDLKKYGADFYTISFDAKSVDDKSYAGQIRIDNIQYEGYQEIDRRVVENFTTTGEWVHYEVKVDLTKWDTSDNSLEFIRICSANTPGYDVLFKNIKMTKSSATREPDYYENQDSVCRIVGVSASVIEDGNLGLHYYIDLDSHDNTSDNNTNDNNTNYNYTTDKKVQLRYTKEGTFADFDQECISYDELLGLYRYTVWVNAGDMTEEIGIRIVPVSGGTALAQIENTVEDYMNLLLANNVYADKHALVKAVLNYGTAVQVYFDRNIDKPANGGLNANDRILSTIPSTVLEPYNALPTMHIDGITYYGSSLLLKEHIVLRHYFVCEDGFNIDNCAFFVNDVAVTCSGKDGICYVDIDVSIYEIQSIFELKVQSNSQTGVLRYGPMHYASRVENDASISTELKDVVRSMYQLSEAVVSN